MAGVVDAMSLLKVVPGGQDLARDVSLTPPQHCELGIWTLGEVRGMLQRIQVCCQDDPGNAFLRLSDGGGWFASNVVAIGDALRMRSDELCRYRWRSAANAHDRALWTVHGASDAVREWNCGTNKHVRHRGTRALAPLSPSQRNQLTQ